MIEFSIPDSPGTTTLNFVLLETIKNTPEMFYDDFKISSTYGTFAGCCWNGGRDIIGLIRPEDCKEILNFYNERDVFYRYTFTNSLITKRDFYDRYCNMLLKINKRFPSITYNRSDLKRYINKHNKDYKFVQSCTKCVKNIKEINKYSKKELIVLDFDLNNENIIDKIKYPENIELAVNEACLPNCPFKKAHYEFMSKKCLYEVDIEFMPNKECTRKVQTYEEMVQRKKHYVSRDKIKSIYVPRGINKFKISGRDENRPDFALFSYLDYFVKPEYHQEFVDICRENKVI